MMLLYICAHVKFIQEPLNQITYNYSYISAGFSDNEVIIITIFIATGYQRVANLD